MFGRATSKRYPVNFRNPSWEAYDTIFSLVSLWLEVAVLNSQQIRIQVSSSKEGSPNGCLVRSLVWVTSGKRCNRQKQRNRKQFPGAALTCFHRTISSHSHLLHSLHFSAAEANKEDATDSLHSPSLIAWVVQPRDNETEVLWKIHTAIIELQRQYHKSETLGGEARS